ncbi:hypothetical protein DRQ33_00015 [bacterium]|nr:MAG: hypothetical protein DRQ33_00015 [bacterium]
MKKIYIIVFLILGAIYSQEYVSLSNGYVGIVVDKSTGQFAIGDMSSRGVIEGYPNDPAYTHFCLKFNESFYCNDTTIGDEHFIIRDSAQVVENTISMVWNVGTNRVWEKFYTLEDDSLTGFIYIEYVFYNDHPSESAIVGFTEYMDIRIGDNDDPTIVLPAQILEIERKFVDFQVPAYWTFFEDYEDTNSFLGQGVPFGREEIYVDAVIFSDVEYIDTITWDYMALARTIDDLAIFMRWNTRVVNPYELYVMGHYYGLGYPDASIQEMLEKLVPSKFILGAPFPNPTNGVTSIKIEILDYNQDIDIEIIDIQGRLVDKIYSGSLKPGTYYYRWDLKDHTGQDVPSGIYYFRVHSNPGVNCRPVIIVR